MFSMASLALDAVILELPNHRWKHNLRIGLDNFFFVHSDDVKTCRAKYLSTECAARSGASCSAQHQPAKLLWWIGRTGLAG